MYANLLSSDCPYPPVSSCLAARNVLSIHISYVHTWPGCRRTCRRSYAYTVTPIAPKAGPVDLEMPRIAASIWNSAPKYGQPVPEFRPFPPINLSEWMNVCMWERERERIQRVCNITFKILQIQQMLEGEMFEFCTLVRDVLDRISQKV